MSNKVKYQFKVYLKNGDMMMIVPSQMKGTDLQDYDLFSIQNHGFFGLTQILGKELSIASTDIDKITILHQRKNIEFSLVTNNPYVSAVIFDLYPKKIPGVGGNYMIDAILVPNDHPSYIEMRDYLFQNLQTDASHFLDEVYTYQNQFHTLLYQYASSLRQSLHTEEEERNIQELKQRIRLELSIYKNYRGLCLARKKYEDRIHSSLFSNMNQKSVQNLKITHYATQNLYSMQSSDEDDLTNRTIIFNQEHEEFLEPEEFAQMQGEISSDSHYHY